MGEMTLAAAKAGDLAKQSTGRKKISVPGGHTYPAITSDIGLTRKERSNATAPAGGQHDLA
jgi:hypothetical protein